jgi:hypothetical protein
MALITLLLALPTAVLDTQASQHLYRIPPAFDGFLNVVRRITPPNARFLVLDVSTDPHHHLFERSQYDLYPRRAFLQPVPAEDVARGGLTPQWAALLRRARRHSAQYILVWARPAAAQGHIVKDVWQWSLPTAPRGRLPHGAVRLRHGWGLLVQV